MNTLVNVKIILEDSILENYGMIFDSKIINILPLEQINLKGMNIIDGQGMYLSPGFIDIHKHGAYDYDFMESDTSLAVKLLERLPETGVTSLYPSTLSMSFNEIRRAMEAIRELMQTDYMGTVVLGCHMEGPFLSPDWGGAQPRSFLVPADYKLVEGLEGTIKIVTVAPEEPGNLEFIEKCVKAGIKVSIGHTLAHYEDVMVAFARGAISVTHTFNAMHQLQHREPGVVAAASESPNVFCELIVDNLHIHPATQRVLLKLKGINRIILVTDSMKFTGMGYGESTIAGQHVTINEKGAHLDSGFFAGSVLSLNEAVRLFRDNNRLSMIDAIKPVTANPAKMMGIYGRKGALMSGADADFVLFDENININKTIVKGKVVFSKVDSASVDDIPTHSYKTTTLKPGY